MFRSHFANKATIMIILAVLLAITSGTLLWTSRPRIDRHVLSVTTLPLASTTNTVKVKQVPLAVGTLSPGTSSAVPSSAGALPTSNRPPSTIAPTDAPLPNGPPALFWDDGGTSYRAVHFIAFWDATTRHWQNISPNLTEDQTPNSPGYHVDGITAVANDKGVWYVGTLAGEVTVKLPGHPWSILSGELPQRTVSAVAILPGDTAGQVALLGYGGYGTATPDRPGHVYLTKDSGRLWSDITGNLPDEPVQSLHFSTSGGGFVASVEMHGHWYVMDKPAHWRAWSGVAFNHAAPWWKRVLPSFDLSWQKPL